MPEYSRFVKHLGMIGLVQSLSRVKVIFLLPILTKLLGTYAFGLWVQVISTVELLFPIITISMTGTLTRFLTAKTNRDDVREGFYSIFTFILIFGSFFSVLLWIFAGPISERFFDNNIVAVRIIAYILIIHCLNMVMLSYFRTFKMVGLYSFFFLLENFGGLSVILLLAFNGFGILAVIWSVFFTKLFVFMPMIIFIFSKLGFKKPKFMNFREYLNYSLPSLPANLSSWLVNLSDRYVIAFYLGVVSVGFYSPAYTLGALIFILIDPFTFILMPYLSQHYDHQEIEAVKRILHYSLKYFLFLAIPSFIGLTFLAKPLLNILATQEIAGKSHLVVPLVAAGFIFYGLVILLNEVICLVKKTRIIAYAWVSAGILNLGLNMILIPRYGIVSAGVTTALSYGLAFLVFLIYAKRYLPFPVDWASLIKNIALSLFMGLIFMVINPVTLWQTVMAIVFGVIFYLVFSFLFKVFNHNEISFWKNLIYARFNR